MISVKTYPTILQLVCLVLMVYRANAECCEAWQPYEGNCYQAFLNTKTWTEAEYKCGTYGGHLASITSEGTNDFIKTDVVPDGFSSYLWIGGNDLAEEQTWKWSDGSVWGYTNWDSESYPRNSYSYNCLEMTMYTNKGKWYDEDCCDNKAYICQIPDPDIAQNGGSLQQVQNHDATKKVQDMTVRDLLRMLMTNV